MTRDEKIKILSARDNQGMPITWQNGFIEAYDMAVRSIEAWDKVKQGIAEYLEEYGDTDANGNHCAKWCAMKEAEALINKHLKEVEE